MIKLHVVIDNIRSAYNVGSIFRTADAVGFSKLHICGIAPYPPNPRLEKTALGAIKNVPWVYYKNTKDAIEKLRKDKIPVYAIEITSTSVDYRTIKFPSPVAIILGHEINGVGEIPLDCADKVISIPMRGVKESLNVATAAGIIMFEALRNIR